MAVSRSLKRLAMTAAAALGAAVLAGCDGPTDSASGYRAYAPISSESLALMRVKGSDQNAPMLIRAYKKEAEFEIWKQKKDGKYVLFKTYPMCRWSGQLGPKKTEGDRQVPEGFYSITPGQMNPNSHYYLSFNVGYPNAYDRANGRAGGSIMVHGICSSAGCFSMTDKQIEEIYAVARESFAGGQHAIQMQSFPFRMTSENLAKLRLDPNMPFWREIKKGADYFDVTKSETPVAVCNKHYVFGATPKSGRFDALSPCPAVTTDPEIDSAVAAKQTADDKDVAELVGKGVKPVRIVYQDGGQNPEFAHRIADVSRPDALAAGATELALDDTPKTKPVAVQVAAAKAKAASVKLASAPAAVPAPQPNVVAATFDAAPSAYAKEEPKSETLGMFKKWLNLGSADTPETAPAVDAQPAPATVAPEKSAAPKHIIKSAHAKLPPAAPASGPKPAELSAKTSPAMVVASGQPTTDPSVTGSIAR